MAQGSQTTPAADMPRTCAICGNPILTSKQGFQHHVDHLHHTNQAWHIACKRKETMSDTETTTDPQPTEPTTPQPPEPDTDTDQDDDDTE